MIDLTPTIVPRSDQLNADDLIGGPRTITVTRVSAMKEPDQPVAIYFEGDGGKPYKPGKSMRRVLVRVWGADGTAYAGRRMTLFRDEAVQFGGQAVGGIRISHMSGIPDAVTMALTVTRANRRPFTVKPLRDERGPSPGKAAPAERQLETVNRARGRMSKRDLFDQARAAAAQGQDAFDAFVNPLPEEAYQVLGEIWSEIQEALAATAPSDDDTFPGDREAA